MKNNLFESAVFLNEINEKISNLGNIKGKDAHPELSKYPFVIWGKRFDLIVHFDHGLNEDEIKSHREAFKRFYKVAIIDNSFKYVKKYIETEEDGPTEEITKNNIFKYIKPKSIIVTKIKKSINIGLLCDYKFDPEHGIAIVFENNKYKEIGIQDIIL